MAAQPLQSRQPPEPAGSGGAQLEQGDCRHERHRGADGTNGSRQATDALWQYLKRIEAGLDQIDDRIDRLYVALGGGTVLLATIGLASAFIVRGG